MSEKLTDLDKHESLHTASVVLAMWNDHVFESAYVQSDEELWELAGKAIDAMHNLYSAIGRKSASGKS